MVVGDPEGGVLGAEQPAGGGGDPAQDLADLQVAAHPEQGLADGLDAGQAGFAGGQGAVRRRADRDPVGGQQSGVPVVAWHGGHDANLPPSAGRARRSPAGRDAGPAT